MQARLQHTAFPMAESTSEHTHHFHQSYAYVSALEPMWSVVLRAGFCHTRQQLVKKQEIILVHGNLRLRFRVSSVGRATFQHLALRLRDRNEPFIAVRWPKSLYCTYSTRHLVLQTCRGFRHLVTPLLCILAQSKEQLSVIAAVCSRALVER